MAKLRTLIAAVVGVVVAGMVTTADAALVTVNSGSLFGTFGGAGTGRGQGIRADTDFQLQGLAIFGSLVSQSYDLQIYASTNGSSVGALLTSTNATVGSGTGTPRAWNEIAISYSFNAGSFYVLNWLPSNGSSDFGILEYYNDGSGLPATAGPLTLLDGFGDASPNSGYTIHPSFRYNIVDPPPPPPPPPPVVIPLPAAAWLFLTGLSVVGAAAWRKQRAV